MPFKRTAIVKDGEGNRVIIRRYFQTLPFTPGVHSFTRRANRLSRTMQATNPGWDSYGEEEISRWEGEGGNA